MATRIQEYLRPTDWPDALKALRRPRGRARPLVIGPRPEALETWEAEAAVDLSRLELDYVEEEDQTIRLGALTPLQTLAASPLLQALADGIVSQAAALAGGLGVRNVASLAGALAPGEGSPEVRLALLALEASIVLRGEATRECGLMDLELRDGELIVEARLANRPTAHGSLQRVGRSPRDQSIVAAAVTLEASGGVCRWARVAVAGAGPQPQRLPEVEALLAGQRPAAGLLAQVAEAASAAVRPHRDYRGSAVYRKSMSGVLVRRTVGEA